MAQPVETRCWDALTQEMYEDWLDSHVTPLTPPHPHDPAPPIDYDHFATAIACGVPVALDAAAIATAVARAIPAPLIENAQRHFQGSLIGCFEYVPYTALTIVCTINVSIDCKKNKVSNPFTRKNILD